MRRRVVIGSDPPQQPGGIAGVYTRVQDIARHHGPSADYGAIANRYRQYGRVRAYGNMTADARRLPQFSSASRGTAGCKKIVDEHHSVTDKAVLSDLHQLADEGM